MARRTSVTVNLLELQPRRRAEWVEEEGRVVVLVPKFRNRFMVRFILPHLRSQHFRVKLDALGSAVWRRCDGATTVERIGEDVRREFGDAAEPLYDRIASFLKKLEHGELIEVTPPGPSHSTA